jgi:chromosome segregation ATPase
MELGRAQEEIRLHEEALAMTQDELAKLEVQAARAVARIESAGLTPQAVDPVLQTLIVRKLEYELDLHGKEARRQKIVELIVERRERGGAQVTRMDELILKEHAALIQAAEAEFARMSQLYEQKAVPEVEIAKARAKLEQARAQYEYQQAKIEHGVQEAAGPLTDELRDLSIETTELRARHAFAAERLNQFKKMPAVRDQYMELIGNQVPAARARIDRLRSQIQTRQVYAKRLTEALAALRAEQEKQEKGAKGAAPGAPTEPPKNDGDE